MGVCLQFSRLQVSGKGFRGILRYMVGHLSGGHLTKSAFSLICLLSIAGLMGLSGCGRSRVGATVTNTPVEAYSIPITETGGTATNVPHLQIAVQELGRVHLVPDSPVGQSGDTSEIRRLA
jgi:hypothetical protein